MINGAEKHGIAKYKGFNYWPKINIPCETCGDVVALTHNAERDDRIFCSIKCHRAVKKCKKNAMKDYSLLRILRDNPVWIGIEDLTYVFASVAPFATNAVKVHYLLKKWISKGIVEQDKSSSKSSYRLNPKYQNELLGALVIKHRTPKPYAESLKL